MAALDWLGCVLMYAGVKLVVWGPGLAAATLAFCSAEQKLGWVTDVVTDA